MRGELQEELLHRVQKGDDGQTVRQFSSKATFRLHLLASCAIFFLAVNAISD